MDGYTKLFGSITDSTIWDESPVVCKVWVTMLAKADRHGEVHASLPGLAHAARVTVAKAQTALDRFLAPDPHSRTPDHEGRRIEAIDGGWRLLNYQKYRELMSVEDRREKDRARQQKHRLSRDVTPMSRDVTPVTPIEEKENENRSKPPKTGDGIRYASQILQSLGVPSDTRLMRLVGDAVNFRVARTGNPEGAEADFIIAQANQWRASPDGTKNPRMSWPTWFQGQHYNDDPKTWEQSNGRTERDLLAGVREAASELDAGRKPEGRNLA